MASYNRVILVGNLTRDVELRYTQSGLAVTDVGLAMNDRRKNQAGDWVEETTFVEVTFWGRTAEVAGEYLSKGSSVLIEGRLKLDTWETDGQKRSKLHVVCERMQMLGGKQGGSSGGGHSPSQQPNRQAAAPAHDNSAPTGGTQGPTGGTQGPTSGDQGPTSGDQGPTSGDQGPKGPPEDEIPF